MLHIYIHFAHLTRIRGKQSLFPIEKKNWPNCFYTFPTLKISLTTEGTRRNINTNKGVDTKLYRRYYTGVKVYTVHLILAHCTHRRRRIFYRKQGKQASFICWGKWRPPLRLCSSFTCLLRQINAYFPFYAYLACPK